MKDNTTIKPLSAHPMLTEAQALEWETWRAMAELITQAGIDFNRNTDVSKAIAAWGYRYLKLALEYAEERGLDEPMPPSFYSPKAELRIRDTYLALTDRERTEGVLI